MNWFWHTVWICFVVIPVAILWGASIFDIVVRRKDLVWWKRVLWLVLVLVIPVIGALIYIAVAAGGTTSTDLDIHELERLHSQGDLSNADYERQLGRMDSSTGR
jgi:hypothetical protein